MNTREMIRRFNLAFDRPVNSHPTQISVTERELLGKLLLEETLEFCVKGLGLNVSVEVGPKYEDCNQYVAVNHHEGALLNHVECADGLGDVNVVTHFCSHWLGYNLDAVTEEINDSNMSKLGEDGKPIINECVNRGYCEAVGGCEAAFVCGLMDPTQPVGKILKGPNFRKPNLAAVLDAGNL